MKTRITEMLGIEYPIIQGGMAWVAEHHLAAAVSEAGGLGLIGGANAPGEVVREEIRKAKALTKKPFGVNVMLMSPYADDVAKVVVEEGVKDGKFYTSSGVSAGMDMALGFIADYYGSDLAQDIANHTEYHWQKDPSVDSFARIYGYK